MKSKTEALDQDGGHRAGTSLLTTAGWAGSREISLPWPPFEFFPVGARGRLGLPSWHEDVALIPPTGGIHD